VCDSGFDDKIGLNLPDQFLNGHHILGILNDGAREPGKVVGILWDIAGPHEIIGGITYITANIARYAFITLREKFRDYIVILTWLHCHSFFATNQWFLLFLHLYHIEAAK